MDDVRTLARSSPSYVLGVTFNLCLLVILLLVPLLKLIEEQLALQIWIASSLLALFILVLRLSLSGVRISDDVLRVTTVLRTNTVTRQEASGMTRKSIWFTGGYQRVPTLVLTSGRQVKFTFMIGRSTKTIDLVAKQVRHWRVGCL